MASKTRIIQIFFLVLSLTLLQNLSCLEQTQSYETTEAFALECDKNDPLTTLRDQFLIPKDAAGKALVYFCGHSLGLQPKTTQTCMQEELNAWATLGVEGHFKAQHPWYSYHTLVRDSLARLTGAHAHEVVAMNSLTVNLHLMLISFYRPTAKRYKILMEAPVFSSDTYAIKSQIELRGYNPDKALIIATPRACPEPRRGRGANEHFLRIEDIDALLEQQGDEIALVLFSGVNYFNGQLIDMEHVTKKAHAKGCLVGFDLAHTIGNVPLQLHDWDVDFAAWCSYKYLNAGPGAIGGVFVHERHCNNETLQRLAGWWGNDPESRFQLHLQPKFIPVPSADSWQISNPSIFALIPLLASLQLFDSVGMQRLREKSLQLTGYLEFLLDTINSDQFSIITPRDPRSRGCQLSIKVDNQPQELMDTLRAGGIICDLRRPDILRIVPVPMYNTFHEVWQFATIFKNHLDGKIL